MTVHLTLVHFAERLAGQAEGLEGIAGRAFSSYLPHKLNKSYVVG